MRETRADTARAFGYALLLHVLLFAVLVGGLWWTRSAAPAGAAGAMDADLVDMGALPASMRRALAKAPNELPAPVVEPEPEPAPPLPQPEPEPVPQEAVEPPQPKPQDFIPVPDAENRPQVVEQPTPKPAVEKTPQEAKQTQEQVDLTEAQRQRDAEQARRRAEQEAVEKRLAEIRRRRAAAAREAQLAEQRLQQLADARAGQAAEEAARSDAAAGAGGVDKGLEARYAAALQAAIEAKWTRPDSIQPGELCRLSIRQLPGGEVVSVEVSSPCSYDEQGRRSIEAAVLKAQPLPYAGFEPVFRRQLTVNFRAGQ